jgi:peroxiredoxin
MVEEAYGADAQQVTSGAKPHTAHAGQPAPDFALLALSGETIRLSALRERGPVVMMFYRGGWCPFCNMHLRAFQLARTQLRALGAPVVLLSPALPGHIADLRQQHDLLFPLLRDVGNQVARQYGLVFQMPAELREEYLADGVDLAAINGDDSWEVPMPATFVVDQQGVIQYAFVSADYTQRAELSEVIAVLRNLARRSKVPQRALR